MKGWLAAIVNGITSKRLRTSRKIALVATLVSLVIVYFFTSLGGVSYRELQEKEPGAKEYNRNENENDNNNEYIPGRDMSQVYGELQSPPWAISNGQDVPANLGWTSLEVEQVNRENATMIMLVRNSEMNDAIHSIQEIERTFNHRYHYPWIFMNDIPFTEEFIDQVKNQVSGESEFVEIPHEYWSVPEWIDVDEMMKGMAKLKEQNVPYADLLSYRHMCRFNSGFFYKLDALQKYQYYWRVEPAVEFYCNLTYDPFTFLKENNLMYGFVMAVYEFGQTIPNLWNTVLNFTAQYPHMVAANNTIDLIVDGEIPDINGKNSINKSTSYNNCHFWSNFEIGNLQFFRSDAYNEFFNYLDSSNGFFYERWGDAPVHTIALSLLLSRQQIHHFGDIGYTHSAYTHCPVDSMFHKPNNPLCSCKKSSSADTNSFSCLDHWWKVRGKSLGDFT